MTEYHIPISEPSPITLAARAAKARRQAVLERVQAQRAKAYTKKTGAKWVQVGTIIRGSELKK
jgi:hypothetical protein